MTTRNAASAAVDGPTNSIGFVINPPLGTQMQGGTVDSPRIKNGGVTTTDILDGTMTSADIASSGVGNADIQAGAVTNSKIAGGQVTGDKISHAFMKQVIISEPMW